MRMLRIPALLLQAKTHQWTREAHLTSPRALRPPRPRWPFRWRCSGLLSRRGTVQQTRCTGSSISSPPASQPTASALPHEHQRCCLDATRSRVVPQSGNWEANPPRGHFTGAVPAPVSSWLPAPCQHRRTGTRQPPSSPRLRFLGSQLLSPAGLR